MKRLIILLSFLLPTLMAVAQDPALKTRLEAFMQLNHLKQLDKVLDYTYPKLFTIASREDIKVAMEKELNMEADGFRLRMEKSQIVTIHPIIQYKNGQYAKISATAGYSMEFIESEDWDIKDTAELREIADAMIRSMTEEDPATVVKYDASKKSIVIIAPTVMIAAKDTYSKEWSFLNFGDDMDRLTMLLDKELVTKLMK